MRRNTDQTCRRVSEAKIVSTKTAWGFLPRLYVEQRRRGPCGWRPAVCRACSAGSPPPTPFTRLCEDVPGFTDGLVASAQRVSENWCFIPLLVSF